MKADAQRREEKIAEITSYCVAVGAIEECDVHDGVYIDNLEFLDSDELADAIVEEHPEVLAGFTDREEFVSCVQDAMQGAGEECPCCEKNARS